MTRDRQPNESVCQQATKRGLFRGYRLGQRIDIAVEPFDQGHITEGFYDTALNEANDV